MDQYYQMFGNKDFMSFQAQSLPSYITHNAYQKDEEAFMKTVRAVPVENVPPDANIITIHVIYKVKHGDDGSRIMKSRIAPHGNKDREKRSLKSDSSTCPPVGIRILLSLAVLF